MLGTGATSSRCRVAPSMFRSRRCSRGSTRVIATPAATGPPGPTDAVDVGVGVRRDVEVDDVRHVIDVQAARGHVGRDEDVERPVAEAAHHPIALLLGHPAVDRRRVMAVAARRSASSSTSPRVRANTRAEVGSSRSRIRPRATSLSARRTT